MIRKANKFVGEFVAKKTPPSVESEPDPRPDSEELTVAGWKWPAYGMPEYNPKTAPDGIDMDDL